MQTPENGSPASPPRGGPVGEPPLPPPALGGEPTLLHELPRFADLLRAEAASIGRRGPAQVLMKREDLMPSGLGGNKLRSLEYVVGDAIARGATDLRARGG